MNAVVDFLGRLHPVLVHLPIGFLMLAIILQWLSHIEKYRAIQPAVQIAYLLGVLSAVFSCCSGWILSTGGEYDAETLLLHKWFGISVAIASGIGYWQVFNSNHLVKKALAICVLLLIIITGHLGGSLTHGEGFLTKNLFQDTTAGKPVVKKAIANVQEAMVFSDVIQPVLDEKCGSCHSAKKQKGGLRLDGRDWILKGGKNGQVYALGNPEGSELYKRVVLDPLEEKHMPPKGKPQLTEKEMKLLHWWIGSNAGFDKKVKEIPQPADVTAALTALQKPVVQMETKTYLPGKRVEKIAPAILDAMRKAGITILPVAANSNYLLANFISIPQPKETDIALLKQATRQLVWLKLGYATLSAASWKILGDCEVLTRLSLEHTNITDADLSTITRLKHLQYLNLSGTKISAKGLEQLKANKFLEQLYVGNTIVKPAEYNSLHHLFPKTDIDTGNYRVTSLSTDTQRVKAPVVKK